MTGITVFNAQNCGIHQSGITVLCFRNDGSESSGILNKSLLKQIDIKVKRRTILSIADMELSITDLCPFNCSYCSKKENKSTKDYVTIEEWKKVIKEAYLMGANGIKLTGGEPLHPLVIDKTLSIAKYAREIGYERVVLLTSGYSLADNIQRVVEAGITEISICYLLLIAIYVIIII